MRAPLSWIRDFAPVTGSTAEIVDALNQLGLEVEAVDEPGRELRGVVVARVLDVVAHPKADKLVLVDVDHGSGSTRVVCGAPNVVPGMVVPYAPAGAELPGGLRLERRTIRGVTSDGMLCSARELGLGDDHAGILGLDDALPLGGDVKTLLGLDDVVFDLSITPNRPDAMSIVGVARDLAAHFGLPFAVPEPSVAEAPPATATRASVRVDAPDRCPRYAARVATVRVGPSPTWLAQRLVLAGMRPISNVVDVTNYVLLERGQPLHAFDLDTLPGRGVVVRLARDGERIVTLDGVERVLTTEDLLICDAEDGPQAVAGVMGGGPSEVSGSTTEILLEAAYFEPMGIARTSKRLGLRSESSARFERGVDPNGARAGADRACELLAVVADAAVAAEPIDVYPEPVAPARITLRTARVNALLGTALDASGVRDALVPLGIEIEGAGEEQLTARVPTFRPDLEREIDLVEEVARRVGFNEIPRTLPSNPDHHGGLTREQRERRLVVDALVGMGPSEAITLPLVAPGDLAGFGGEDAVEVANPLRAEESVLRTALLPGLLRAVAYNAAHGQADLALFEVGHVFRTPTSGAALPDERDHVAAALAGTVRRRPVEADRGVDVYDAADLVRAVAEALRLADCRLEAASAPGLQPGRTASIVVDGAPVGHVGAVAPTVLSRFGLAAPVVAFEADLDALLGAARRARTYRAPSVFPASGVDLAFVVDDDVPAADVARTLAASGGELLEDVALFDVFRAEALGPGRKSLAFSLRFRAPGRTLTDEETGRLRRRAIDEVARVHGGELRG